MYRLFSKCSGRFPLLLFLCAVMIPTVTTAATPSTPQSLYDATDSVTLGLSTLPNTEIITIFNPTYSEDHFANGVVMTAFRGQLYGMWQSSRQDEDAPDTRVVYSRSEDDGQTWCAPVTLCDDHTEGYCTSGGWIATEERLIAFINVWQTAPESERPTAVYTRYMTSTDGIHWTRPAAVTMADGSPMQAIFEQDPHRMASGRWIGAAHFGAELRVCPIYTDDPMGVSGWHKGDFQPTPRGEGYREIEPSLYVRPDGAVVMLFRDQASSFRKLCAISHDHGASWSEVEVTDLPDARTKQSAGNLPDGTAFTVGNPVDNKIRIPLVITLSRDGEVFDRAYLLGAGGEAVPPVRYAGRAKRRGYHYPKSLIIGDRLYVSYALNKEQVQFCRVPLSALNTTYP